MDKNKLLSTDIGSDLSRGDNGDRCIELSLNCKTYIKKCDRINTNDYLEL